MRKGRIAVICNYELKPERIGGMDRFYVAYDKKCKENGFEIVWYFSNYTGFPFYNELTIYSADKGDVQKFFLSQAQKEKQFDIVITHFIELCTPFFKEVKRRINASVISVDHNPRPLNGFPLKKRLKNRLKGLLYSKYINLFIGVSKYTQESILSDYGTFLKKKTKTIYNGIDADVYKINSKNRTPNFIVASHLRLSKGVHDLIMAVSALPGELKTKIKIDIYGEGPQRASLDAMVKKENLETVIHFKGSSSRLNELFSRYSYMFQPTYMECFSLSILESLAANVPVITTDVGGNLEVIKDGDNGFIHKPGDVEKLSGIIQDIILEKKQIRANVSSKVRDRYTIENMVNNHYNLLACI